MFPNNDEDYNAIIDIVFIMGQFGVGEYAYNYVVKICADKQMDVEQYVKLYLTFHAVKKGDKQWLDKLIKGIFDNIHLTTSEQLTSVLTPLS